MKNIDQNKSKYVAALNLENIRSHETKSKEFNRTKINNSSTSIID